MLEDNRNNLSSNNSFNNYNNMSHNNLDESRNLLLNMTNEEKLEIVEQRRK